MEENKSKVEKIPYKNKYLKLEEKYKELESKFNAANDYIKELQEELKILDPQPIITTHNIDYKNERDQLLEFYNLINKHLVFKREADIYSINIMFTGPNGKSIIRNTKDMVSKIKD